MSSFTPYNYTILSYTNKIQKNNRVERSIRLYNACLTFNKHSALGPLDFLVSHTNDMMSILDAENFDLDKAVDEVYSRRLNPHTLLKFMNPLHQNTRHQFDLSIGVESILPMSHRDFDIPVGEYANELRAKFKTWTEDFVMEVAPTSEQYIEFVKRTHPEIYERLKADKTCPANLILDKLHLYTVPHEFPAENMLHQLQTLQFLSKRQIYDILEKTDIEVKIPIGPNDTSSNVLLFRRWANALLQSAIVFIHKTVKLMFHCKELLDPSFRMLVDAAVPSERDSNDVELFMMLFACGPESPCHYFNLFPRMLKNYVQRTFAPEREDKSKQVRYMLQLEARFWKYVVYVAVGNRLVTIDEQLLKNYMVNSTILTRLFENCDLMMIGEMMSFGADSCLPDFRFRETPESLNLDKLVADVGRRLLPSASELLNINIIDISWAFVAYTSLVRNHVKSTDHYVNFYWIDEGMPPNITPDILLAWITSSTVNMIKVPKPSLMKGHLMLQFMQATRELINKIGRNSPNGLLADAWQLYHCQFEYITPMASSNKHMTIGHIASNEKARVSIRVTSAPLMRSIMRGASVGRKVAFLSSTEDKPTRRTEIVTSSELALLLNRIDNLDVGVANLPVGVIRSELMHCRERQKRLSLPEIIWPGRNLRLTAISGSPSLYARPKNEFLWGHLNYNSPVPLIETVDFRRIRALIVCKGDLNAFAKAVKGDSELRFICELLTMARRKDASDDVLRAAALLIPTLAREKLEFFDLVGEENRVEETKTLLSRLNLDASTDIINSMAWQMIIRDALNMSDVKEFQQDYLARVEGDSVFTFSLTKIGRQLIEYSGRKMADNPNFHSIVDLSAGEMAFDTEARRRALTGFHLKYKTIGEQLYLKSHIPRTPKENCFVFCPLQLAPSGTDIQFVRQTTDPDDEECKLVIRHLDDIEKMKAIISHFNRSVMLPRGYDEFHFENMHKITSILDAKAQVSNCQESGPVILIESYPITQLLTRRVWILPPSKWSKQMTLTVICGGFKLFLKV